MSSWVDLDDEVVEIADEIAKHLGCDVERVIKVALALLAVDVGVTVDLPRKENQDE